MAGLPCRPPSVGILLPQNLSYEKVEFDQVCVPANALIIAENEQIFLAMANVLKELKAVLIGDAGYVYTGKIGSRQVFLLKCRGPGAVVQTIKKLRPRAGLFLGFAKSLVNRPHEIGDIIIAEAVLRRDGKQERLESYGCSECLINVFENGKYGWTPPKYRKQAVHVGKILHMGDVAKNEKASAVAVKTSSLDVSECIKGLGKEWISIVSVTGTPRCHGNQSWEPYVAAVISSFVNRVLEDDQVFAVLGGEGRCPRQHSPLLSDPSQETMDCSTKINGHDVYQFADLSLSQENIRRKAEMNWAQLQYAMSIGLLHLPSQPNSQSNTHSSQDRFQILSSSKFPVENGDRREIASSVSKHLPKSADNPGTHPSLKPTRTLPLPPLISDKYARAETPKRKISAPSAKSKISGRSSQSLCPAVSSIMALTTEAALLPLGATLQSQGSRYDIIWMRAEERTAISSQLDGRFLPPITPIKNK